MQNTEPNINPTQSQSNSSSQETSSISPQQPPTTPQSGQPQGQNPQMGGFLERFVAHFIDAIIVGIASFIIGLLLGLFVYLPISLFSGSDFRTTYDTLNYSYSNFVGIILGFLYYGYFYTTRGQTPGKKLMSLKVVKEGDLRYLNWAEVFIRDVIGKFISGIVFLLGYFWYFMDEKRQTWHDKFASSYVVKTDQNGEVLMTGPSAYKKEPVKTFLPCGCMFLLIAAFATLVFIIVGVGLDSLEENEFNFDSDVETDYDFDSRFDTDPSPNIQQQGI